MVERNRQDLVGFGGQSQIRTEVTQHSQRLGARAGCLGAVMQAPGQKSGQTRHQQKDQKREDILRARDMEAVKRLGEKVIQRSKARDSGKEARPETKSHRGQQNRHQKDHGQGRFG